MSEPATPGTQELKRETADIERSVEAVESSEDRRTILASDRTLLAAERTYAAWVRTSLASLAAGIGARALVKEILPDWVGKLTGTVLVLFAGFCLVAAVWRELQGVSRTSIADMRPLPHALLVPMNFFLLLVVIAALIGIWTA